ncbi:hypothetical protein BST61_g3001 [Cercospora zeina]
MPAPRGAPVVPYDKYPLMRLVLHQMRIHHTTLSGVDRLAIFNAIFHDQLEEAGFDDGKLTSHDKLDSQYRESRKQKNQQKWSGIIKNQDELDDEDFKVYQTMMALIEAKGLELGKNMVSTGNGSSDEEDSDSDEDDEDSQGSEDSAEAKQSKFSGQRSIRTMVELMRPGKLLCRRSTVGWTVAAVARGCTRRTLVMSRAMMGPQVRAGRQCRRRQVLRRATEVVVAENILVGVDTILAIVML